MSRVKVKGHAKAMKIAGSKILSAGKKSKPNVSLKYSEIPEYLRSSALYQSFNGDDHDAILIPEECFKGDDSISSLEDFVQLLRTTIFWGLDTLPASVTNFGYENKYSRWGKVAESVIGSKSFLWEELGYISVAGPIRGAIKFGRTNVVEDWVEQRSVDPGSVAAAAECGRLDYLELFHANGCSWDHMTCRAAAANGHLDCLKFAHEHGCPWTVETFLGAMEGRHMACFTYARENGCPWDDTVTQEAAGSGYVEALHYAITNDCPIHQYACAAAGRGGHLDCLRVIFNHVRGLQIVHEAANPAPEGEQLVPFPPFPWDEYALREAAAGGKLECLMFMHQRGCPIKKAPADGDSAAHLSYLEMLQCQFVDSAADLGHLEMLQYLLPLDFPRSDFFLALAAASNGKDEHGSTALRCVKYLVGEQGMYMNEDGSVFGRALMNANFSVVQYLADNYCPITNFVLDEDTAFELSPLFRKRRKDNPNFDADFALCIECAVGHDWHMDDTFVEFVREHIRTLPLTNEYFDNQGW